MSLSPVVWREEPLFSLLAFGPFLHCFSRSSLPPKHFLILIQASFIASCRITFYYELRDYNSLCFSKDEITSDVCFNKDIKVRKLRLAAKWLTNIRITKKYLISYHQHYLLINIWLVSIKFYYFTFIFFQTKMVYTFHINNYGQVSLLSLLL